LDGGREGKRKTEFTPENSKKTKRAGNDKQNEVFICSSFDFSCSVN
jgi:hypothetical protein